MSKTSPVFVLAREAAREPFSFEVGGDAFEIPHVADLDQIALAEFLSSGDLETELDFRVGLLRFAMTAEDFDRLRAHGLKRAELAAIVKAYQDHNGGESGESSASTA